MFKIKNILVPTDFSNNSIQAYDFGLYLANQNGAVLHLIHVVAPDFSIKIKFHDGMSKDYLNSKIMEAEEELRRFITRIKPTNIKIVESLKVGDPADEIIDYTYKNKIDLIAISSHGWSIHSHLSTGSVTTKILNNATYVQVVCVRANQLKTKQTRINIPSTWAENWVG